MAGRYSSLARLVGRGCLATTLVLLALSGCGSKGNVNGKVYYKDSALPSGVVSFVANDKTVGTATIQEDGSYSMKKVAVGEATVVVSTGPATLNKSGKKGAVVEIPKDYGDPAKSREKYTVKSGDQEYDIRLK
jgi:hypothetical protein